MLSSFFKSALGRDTLVAADDTWTLLFILVASVATAIFLEQKYAWASKISGAIIALIMALVLSNLGIIPINSTLYRNSTTTSSVQHEEDLERNRPNDGRISYRCCGNMRRRIVSLYTFT